MLHPYKSQDSGVRIDKIFGYDADFMNTGKLSPVDTT